MFDYQFFFPASAAKRAKRKILGDFAQGWAWFCPNIAISKIPAPNNNFFMEPIEEQNHFVIESEMGNPSILSV